MADKKFSAFTEATSLDGTEKIVGLKNGDNAKWASSLSVITVKVSLSSAEILALNSTPKTLIAAPGLGKFIRPIAFVTKLNFGTTQYTGNTMQYVLVGNLMATTSAYTASSGTTELKNSSQISTTSSLENQAMTVNIVSANPSSGDGTVDIYITYTIITS